MWLLSIALTMAAVAGGLALAIAWVRLGVERSLRSLAELQSADASLVRDADRLGQEFATVRLAQLPAMEKPIPTCLQSETRVLARDKSTAELVALVSLAPEVTADDNVDGSTAVFVWRGDRWQTNGRRVERLTPEQTLQRYASRLSRVA